MIEVKLGADASESVSIEPIEIIGCIAITPTVASGLDGVDISKCRMSLTHIPTGYAIAVGIWRAPLDPIRDLIQQVSDMTANVTEPGQRGFDVKALAAIVKKIVRIAGEADTAECDE